MNPSDPNTQAEANAQAGQEVLETREWLDSLDYVLEHGGPQRGGRLLQQRELPTPLSRYRMPFSATTPYQKPNTTR